MSTKEAKRLGIVGQVDKKFLTLREASKELELLSMRQKQTKVESEKLYNHFHLEAISNNIDRQREYAIQI